MSGKKNENAARERVWYSPHCLTPFVEPGLFEFVPAPAGGKGEA